MKFLYSLIFFVTLVSCSPKSTSDESSDSTQVVAVDSVSVQSADSVVDAKPAKAPIAEVKAEKKDPSQKILKCKFQSIEEGDCLHIIFDCADFGTATTASLPADQLKLWASLTVFEGHGDFPAANPELVGKTFEMIHNYTEGFTCEPGPNGEAVKGKVPNILSFKLIAN